MLGRVEVREHAVHRVVQGTRRAQQARGVVRRRAAQRCGRRFRGQPRTGGRPPRRTARHPRDDRDAGDDAVRQGRTHAIPRCDRGAVRRLARRGDGTRQTPRGERRDVRSSIRRRTGHRRAGNRCARAARRSPRSRRDRRAGGWWWTYRRCRGRGGGARRGRSSACRARHIPRWRPRSTVSTGRPAERRWPRGSRSSAPAS